MGSKEGCGRSGNVGTLDARSACARAHGTLATREIKKEAEKGQGERARIASTRNARNGPQCLHCHALATSQRMQSSATRHRAPNAFARACCTSHSQGGQLLSASRSRGHDFPTLLRVAATLVLYTYFSREGFLCRAYVYYSFCIVHIALITCRNSYTRANSYHVLASTCTLTSTTVKLERR